MLDDERRDREVLVAEERQRISREMHDEMAQVLAYVNVKAQAVKELLLTGRTEDAIRHLDQLAAAAREVYGDARESILGLREAAVPGRSLADALRDQVGDWEARHGIPCSLRIDSGVRLSENAELQLQLIVQEALANALKHAQARRVEVSLQREEGRILASVRDDGLGFDPGPPGSAGLPRLGLAVMRERAESIGGSLRLDSSLGKGTRVTVEVPAPPSS